jgi:hypothetical protein
MVVSQGKMGNLGTQRVVVARNRVEPETKRQSAMNYCSFIFCSSDHEDQPSKTSNIIASILGNITIAAAGLGSFGAVGPIAMSCIPVVVPLSLTRTSNTAYSAILSDDAKSFIKGITYVSIGQGTLAMIDFMFGDLLSGFMKAIFAGLGFYVSHMDDGVSILPSFTVVSFVNGSIAMLTALERMSSRMTPLFSGMMPLYLNYIHLSQILHPLLCFSGAYLGWQIIKELRRSGAFASPGYAGQSDNVFQQNQEQQRGRLLSTSSIASNSRNFVPFNGRGHSLSEPQPST